MPEIPDVVGGNTIESQWGNDIRNRALMRYIDSAARDASVPLPVAGEMAYLTSTTELTIYDGTSWVTYAIETRSYTKAEADGRFAHLANELNMVGDLRWAALEGSGVGIGLRTTGDGLTLRLGEQISGVGTVLPTLRFHTGHVGNTYDVRFEASGGVAGVAGGGDLRLNVQHFDVKPRQVSGLGRFTSDYGFELTGYNPSPAGFGSDIFGAQTRNIIASDQAPTSGNGENGDVWLQYA